MLPALCVCVCVCVCVPMGKVDYPFFCFYVASLSEPLRQILNAIHLELTSPPPGVAPATPWNRFTRGTKISLYW
uniref:Putative secreted protein n=1 Tax=Anopheles darlingi TaxID=43151 RepID=A0A2M4D922_ANODA